MHILFHLAKKVTFLRKWSMYVNTWTWRKKILTAIGFFFLLFCLASLTIFLQKKQSINQHASGATNLSVSLGLHGIGNAGDSANPNGTGNTNPKHGTRN